MTPRSRGFTLIEQIAAITVAGAASAVALPPLLDLQAQAESTTLASLAGAATSAMVVNQGGCLVSGHRPVQGKCVTIGNCADVGAVMLMELPPGYRVADQPLGASGSNGVLAQCTLGQDSSGAEARFLGISAGR
jgi:prepilin-type N-terminal cleavage/methylation domain-containing protein